MSTTTSSQPQQAGTDEAGAERPRSASRSRKRADIQALRALAVSLVVLYHFWPGRMPGGYIGVDVFFVISGFLITGHLLREARTTGRIALGRFWARRARRLLPAAYLVVAVCVVATVFVTPISEWHQWFQEMAGATLYAENWVLASNAVNYLAAENAPSPVQHYWSLSAEEQFYIVWPLLVLGAALLATRLRRNRRRTVAAILTVATVASFLYSLSLTRSDPAAAYFVTPARAWQFGAGALLAVWTTGFSSSPSRWLLVRSLASWAGLVLLALGGVVLFDASTPFPGTAALVPVLGTMAVIWAAEPDHVLSPGRLLGLRPIGYLGDISYSLYLWHWPPLIVLPLVLGHELDLKDRLALLVAAVVVAALSKRFVEDPARTTHKLGLHRTGRTFALTAAAAAVLVVACVVGTTVASNDSEHDAAVAAHYVDNPPPCFGAAAVDPEHPCTNPDLDDVVVPAPEAVSQDVANYPGCWDDVDVSTLRTGCTFGPVNDPKVPHIILVGDSHARAMLPALVDLADEGVVSVTAQLKATCAWTTGKMNYDDPARSRSCQTWKAKLQPWLVSQAKKTDLILTTGYLKTIGGTTTQQVKQMAAAWLPLAKLGVPIVGLADNPYHDYLPYKCLEKLGTITPHSCGESEKKAFPSPDTFTLTAKKVPGAKSVDLTPFYCTDGTCPSIIGGVDVYRDNSHLTTTYTRTLAPYLLRELRQIGALPRDGE